MFKWVLNRLWAIYLKTSRIQLSLWWSVIAKILNELLFLQKSSIVNVQVGSKYASVACKD